jgi:ribosomal protein S18 acetylase RimI-like enzyme
MADVRLRPMSEDAYTDWRGQAVADFARGRERSAGVTAVDAMADAQAEFDRLLPAGLDTPGTHLFTALDARNGAPVGMVWLAERGDGASRQGFIYDILVSPQLRGQGFSTARGCIIKHRNTSATMPERYRGTLWQELGDMVANACSGR